MDNVFTVEFDLEDFEDDFGIMGNVGDSVDVDSVEMSFDDEDEGFGFQDDTTLGNTNGYTEQGTGYHEEVVDNTNGYMEQGTGFGFEESNGFGDEMEFDFEDDTESEYFEPQATVGTPAPAIEAPVIPNTAESYGGMGFDSEESDDWEDNTGFGESNTWEDDAGFGFSESNESVNDIGFGESDTWEDDGFGFSESNESVNDVGFGLSESTVTEETATHAVETPVIPNTEESLETYDGMEFDEDDYDEFGFQDSTFSNSVSYEESDSDIPFSDEVSEDLSFTEQVEDSTESSEVQEISTTSNSEVVVDDVVEEVEALAEIEEPTKEEPLPSAPEEYVKMVGGICTMTELKEKYQIKDIKKALTRGVLIRKGDKVVY